MNDVLAVIGKGLSLRSFLLILIFGSLASGLASAQTRPVPELGAADRPVPSLDPLDVDPDYSFLYDTRTIGLDKEGKRYLFEGDVVLIGGGNVITADKIQVDYTTTTLVAEGHVVLLHQYEVFTGTRIEMQWKLGDFTISNAMLTANDPKKVEEVSRRILGQAPRELAYDAAREEQLRAIQKSKDDMKREFGVSPAREPSQDQVTAYTRLLERERFTRESSPPMLADRDPERRSRLERRRTYWKKSRAETKTAPLPQNYYFRLEGENLQRRDGNLYRVDRGSFTPCRCDEDETPAWGFQADKIDAQQEGYVDLHHPVLTIKGIPILYLPYLKLPLKAKRQSGFLMPSFQSGQQKNGFVYTQPVFLDLGEDADATITTDLFQKRGTRVGVEGRYEARKNSGFRFQTEMIRDTSWMQLRSERNGLLQYHLVDQPFCTQTDPVERAACEKQTIDTLSPPGNTWRGKEEWQGRYFLAPRLSIVSAGKVTSDHRYIEDLYLPEDIVTAFATQANANAFSTAKARMDFDGRDFYLGIGGSVGDNAWSTERYAGQQMPAYFNVQTRLFRLLPAQWLNIPIYAEVQAKTISIDQFDSSTPSLTPTVTPTPTTVEPRLGDGTWQRMAMLLTTPLTTESIVRVDQFTEGELRVISHRSLPEKSSTIRSWRTGFALNLPIDGTGPLPAWIRKPEDGKGQSYVKHIMNWGLSLSMRPSVVRDGPYGELVDTNNAPLVYFPSDRKVFYAEDRDVRDEDMMIPHQRITLSTSHRWQVFDRVLETVPGQLPPNEEAEIKGNLLDMQKQALRELLSVKDQPVTSSTSMFRDKPDGGVDWLINRYRSSDINASEPVNFSVSMSFDYQQEKLRQEQIQRNEELEEQAVAAADPTTAEQLRVSKVNYYNLPESWLGPYSSLMVNWRGVSLTTTSTYNIYKNANTSLSFGLGLPTFWSTSLAMNYVLEKNAELDLAQDKVFFKRIKTTNAGLSSGIIPYITLGANLIQRQVENEKSQYGTSYQIGYDSLSGCWGLRFVREKDLNQVEENANYIVQLAVIFLGNRRNADVSPGLKRQFGVDEENL
ncbi:MAG TPA: putative LPS assembly protein LptD [Oligoflexus sp.]|uniref:putative LPS assembly protein LptD n=1 Tax=Oligoflexus sp. TaxID=1971216 RepID=UPI002D2C35F3|nr:putative LPS assembly protein LptD [Oligoflexus sp.]HYX33122.1 putative LPS assembly protein LptD [Oligoflexus sp.]